MTEVTVSFSRLAGDRLAVRLRSGGVLTGAEPPGPAAESLSDLLIQARLPDPPAVATRALADQLGALLFAGDVGDVLRATFDEDPSAVLLLNADGEMATWPWELARDPETGRSPVKAGAGLVRIVGAAPEGPRPPARGVLVVPESLGEARKKALEAATRHLARKGGIDVFAADTVTGAGLRRMLAMGGAFAHLEAETIADEVILDDGPTPVERIGLDEDTWLVVVASGEPAPELPARLRAAGVPVVVALQTALPVALTAAFDRELYRALASGARIIDAVHRTRMALARVGGPDGLAWASPVIWSAPPADDGPAAALAPFPPTCMIEAGLPSGQVALERIAEPTGPLPEVAPYPDLAGPPGEPMPAPAFIHETIRRVREARHTPEALPDADLRARVSAMRALGAGTAAAEDDDGELTPAERTVRLADRLVDSISRPDLPLDRPDDLVSAAGRVARMAAVHPDAVRQAATALIAGRAVLLRGVDGSGRGRLARLLASELFDFFPWMMRADDAVEEGGWGEAALAANWRGGNASTMGARMPVVARLPGRERRYRPYSGSWLVVLDAERAGGELGALLDRVAPGARSGPAQVPIPADFRLVMTARRLPLALPAWVPVVDVRPSPDPAVERDRWLAALDLRLGSAADSGQLLRRGQAARAVADVMRFTRIFAEAPGEIGQAALAYAVAAPGPVEETVDEALALFLAPRLSPDDRRWAPLLLAFLDGDVDGVFQQIRSALANATSPGDPIVAASLRFAEYLDHLAPQTPPRAQAAGKALGWHEGGTPGERGAPRRLVPLLDGWRRAGGVAVADITAERMRRALTTTPPAR